MNYSTDSTTQAYIKWKAEVEAMLKQHELAYPNHIKK